MVRVCAHSLTRSLVMKSKELMTKTSHAHSLILTHSFCSQDQRGVALVYATLGRLLLRPQLRVQVSELWRARLIR